ncbi:chaplin [Streptomyces sp. enrichment culture]|uniref:chaplin n=1 Tax=Streptomyces sp. enrichment culture TaxID=1795815 RepID=UPI003F570A6B
MSRIAKAAVVIAGTSAVVLSGAGMAVADAGADAVAANSPGVASGNILQIPVNIPINLCGNTIDVIGLLNPAFGNVCANVGKDHKDHGDHKGEHGYGS